MNYPKTYTMSFHVQDKFYINEIVRTTSKNLTFSKTLLPIELGDSTADVSIPTPTFEIAAESKKINLTEEHKSVPLIINSNSEFPARIGLSTIQKYYPGKFLSLSPKIQEIQPHDKAVFELTYNGDFNSSRSFLVPINQSVYPQIASETTSPRYTDSPTTTTSSIILHLGGHQTVQDFILSWFIDVKSIISGIIIGLAVSGLTLFFQRKLRHRFS